MVLNSSNFCSLVEATGYETFIPEHEMSTQRCKFILGTWIGAKCIFRGKCQTAVPPSIPIVRVRVDLPLGQRGDCRFARRRHTAASQGDVDAEEMS